MTDNDRNQRVVEIRKRMVELKRESANLNNKQQSIKILKS